MTGGLERERSKWDNYFPQHDGRARHLSKADMVEEEEIFASYNSQRRERIFLQARRAWILLQPDAKEQFRQISNIH